ncbi:MAG: S1C family serine protease [Verrucomicrobiaceae bacterium]
MKQIFTLLVILGVVTAQAAPRITSLSDLQAIEEKMQKVVLEATPATVSLVSPKIGASGSGVIVSPDGLILTAAHVVDGSREMTVIFPDGREERAKVLGANYSRDAAMAQMVGAGPWPFVGIGDSAPLTTGDLVVAMGHPKGYDPTRRPPVRFGRVMTKGRTGFITTDCTVVGGDSGGPLFDLEGKVIGIHSHINAHERAVNNHAGITGFKKSWAKMLRGDSWGRLGGGFDAANSPAIGVMLDARSGKLDVESVTPGSPGEVAGLRGGDVIVSLNHEEVKNLKDLGEVLIDFAPGDQVSLSVKRDGVMVDLSLKLTSRAQIYRRSRR